ncbi:MAG: FAD assembly factor SdhE [Gammaproteobacteria bacterium]
MIDLKKLRWRCRRGTLELDLMLRRYLDQRFSLAETDEKQAFIRLLDMEDSELLKYLMGDGICDEAALRPIIETVRRLPVE